VSEEARAGIERRFRSNSALIIAMRLVTAGLSLAVVPVLVTHFGVEGFGVWEAVLALAGAASLFQAAISGTLVWRASDAFGRGDFDEIRRLIRIGVGATIALFACVWPLAWLLRDAAERLLHAPASLSGVVSGIFPVVAAVALLGSLGDTLDAAVSGCQRSGVVNVIGAVAHLLNYTLVLVLVLGGGSFWSLAAGQALALAVRVTGSTWVLTRTLGGFSMAPLLPGRRDLAMARYSGLLAVGSLAATLRDQTDKIVLATLASPVWVGYYGMAARLAGLVLEVVRFVYIPTLTAVGAWHALGDWASVGRLYAWLIAVVAVVTGAIVIVVGGLVDHIMVLWIGHPIPEVRLLVWLLLAGTASAAVLTGPGTAICRGCGRPEIETVYLAVNLAMNLALTIALVLVIGPVGTAVATGATWAVASVIFLIVLHRRLDLPAMASWRAVAMTALAGALAAVVFWGSRSVPLPASRPEALVTVAAVSALAGVGYAGLLSALRLVSLRALMHGLHSLRRKPV
jgi:O-antigen/teichoic acid export membrane protein